MNEVNNFKLSITGNMKFTELKVVIDSIMAEGYDCIVVDNGNFVFEKKVI